LTTEICDVAHQAIRSTIEWVMDYRDGDSKAGFLVVLDPTVPSSRSGSPGSLRLGWHPGLEKVMQRPFVDKVVLFSESFGDREEWAYPFEEIALAKAYASWMTGLPSYRIQQDAPYLYQEAMAKYGGSAVDITGQLVVAFSGFEDYFDQMISEAMLAAIKATCLHDMYRPAGLMENERIHIIHKP
jgi:hypothetical protein